MDTDQFVKGFLQDVVGVMERLCVNDIVKFLDVLKEAHAVNQRVFVIGNGGSAATAAHMANDLLLGAAKRGGRGLRVHALTDNVPTLTAAANDIGYSEVFAAQLKVLASPGDVLITISVSGNSPNVIRAIEIAKDLGLQTVGILGVGGGRAGEMVDVAVIVPSDGYGPVESIHLVLDHLTTEYFCCLQSNSSGADQAAS